MKSMKTKVAMPMVCLPGTQISVSRFVFGTASLFNTGNAQRRLSLLEAAVEAGFTHFDTAPYYGFGWAERDLGELIQRHPHVTITSKVGIYSPGGEDASRAAVFMRKAAGRIFPAISRPTVDFNLGRAQKMLEGSLHRLRCEQIALYMLHEPDLPMVATDEWQRWLETEITRGRIGAFGLALTSELLIPFLDNSPELAGIVQVLDSLENCEANCLTTRGKPLQITYGYVSAAQKRGTNKSVSEILRAALVRNPHGAIIVSTTKPERMGQYAKLLESST